MKKGSPALSSGNKWTKIATLVRDTVVYRVGGKWNSVREGKYPGIQCLYVRGEAKDGQKWPFS